MLQWALIVTTTYGVDEISQLLIMLTLQPQQQHLFAVSIILRSFIQYNDYIFNVIYIISKNNTNTCTLILASSVPFRIRVNFNEDEFRKDNTPNGVEAGAGEGDFFGRPGGIMGNYILNT